MSDAIRLIVSDESPIRLAVGEADPIARREIAELQEDVADIEEQLDGFALVDGIYPALTSGAALSLTSPTATEGTWAQRVTDAVDGVAVVDGILGNTVVWNQMVDSMATLNNHEGISTSYDATTGLFSLTNVSRTSNYNTGSTRYKISDAVPLGHKFLIRTDGPTGITATYNAAIANLAANAVITSEHGDEVLCLRVTNQFNFATSCPVGSTITFHLQIFDLTRMFGAGNEPSTVAEFEALFPEPYYPYDAGSLLSVQLEGVESVGFNRWDEQWELGEYAGDGSKRARSNAIRSAGFIPCLPSTEYRWTCANHSSSDGVLNFYDADKTFISRLVGVLNYTVTPPANARYMTFYIAPETTYNHDICINVSNPALNGTYKPYATYQRTIDLQGHVLRGLPDGTCDELTVDANGHAILTQRVGEYTVTAFDGTNTNATTHRPYGYKAISDKSNVTTGTRIICDKLPTTQNDTYYIHNNPANVVVNGPSGQTEDELKAALLPFVVQYPLTTPVTIDLGPLTMTYRVEQGGTESVTYTDATAAPTWRIRYPLDLAATVMANIAPVEQAVATATHAIGDLLCVGWQLYRVTRAIATGEAITQGTNVTPTTVAAEIAAIQ